MTTRGTVALIPRTKRALVALVAALFILSVGLQFVALSTPRSALGATITPDPTPNGCEGVVTTPGSENTNKRLIGGDLTPGGEATYEISFPVDADDVGGDFRITDCVFIDGEAALKFFVDFVPNNENFVLVFTLPIPTTTEFGEEFCNYAKTTESPSQSQASNRKAGPACFIVGGNITIFKENEAGEKLAGAKFHIECDFPTTDAFLPVTIINGEEFESTSGGHIETDATTGSDGLIAIQVPTGTECTITETEAPDGYDLPDDPDVTLTATPGGVTHTFVDPAEFVPEPGLSISKGVSLNAGGPFTASLTTTVGTTVHYRITITNTGNVELTDVTLDDDLFQAAVDACNVPSTLDVGESFSCNYTDTASVGTKTNTATADSEETDEVEDSATVTVEAAPALTIVKSVGLAAGGPFSQQVAVQTGTTVFYQITVTNTGNVDLTGATLTDSLTNLAGAGCVIPASLAVGASFSCVYSDVAETGTTTNVATVDTDQTPPEDDDAVVVASPAPVLIVDKSNDAPNVGGLPTVEEGDTVTFTLDYSFSGDSVANGVIEDVLPAGLTYVADSATDSANGEFEFIGYDAATRTLRWEAAEVTESGSVSYEATVDEGAAELAQPLTNNACISSDDTDEDCTDSDIFVAPPPEAETAPPTDIAGSNGSSTPGGSLLLVLLALAGIVLAVVFVAPTPASIRRRQNR